MPTPARGRSVDPVLILAILVIGLGAGWAASIIVGGRWDMGKLLGVGFAGSLVGGMLASLLAGDGIDLAFSGLLGSVIGATILLFLIQRFMPGWGHPSR
jgi:uncharacterized membrane protein YeaQ/YmgE (transglycosylase-associated protein family)